MWQAKNEKHRKEELEREKEKERVQLENLQNGKLNEYKKKDNFNPGYPKPYSTAVHNESKQN